MNNKIIGLSGTNGSGKDSVGEILAKEFYYLFVSVTELLREEALKRNLPVEREVLREISSEWRKVGGRGVLVDRAYAEYAKDKDKYAGIVMASLRNDGEADSIHDLGGVMVWVDAEPKLRYNRIQDNKHIRGRAGEDTKTFEEFQKEEHVEMFSNSSDNTKLNMSEVKKKCDITLVNNFDSLSELKEALKTKLNLA